MNTLRNDLSASKKKVLIYIFAFLAFGGIVGAFFPMYLQPQWFMLAIAGLFSVLLTINLLANHHYVWILVESGKLKVRYYSVLGFLRKFQAIEIPLSSFRGYTIKNSILDIKKELILKQVMKNKVASYPPVSISTLSHKEHNALIALLNQYAPK